MKVKLFPTCLSVLLFFSACSSPAKQENVDEGKKKGQDSLAVPKPAKPDLITNCQLLHREALKMDSLLLQQTEISATLGKKAILAFTDLAYKCPDDSLSPIYLIKAAQVAQAIRDVPQAKTALDKCIADYPHFRDRPAALFFLGQLYDEATYLNNEQEAKALYQKILDEYPKSPWASSAKGALKFIGMSDKQIMEKLKKNSGDLK